MLGTSNFPDGLLAFSFSPESYQPLLPMPRTKPVSLNAAHGRLLLQGAPSEEQEGLLTCIFMLSELTLFTTLTITHS